MDEPDQRMAKGLDMISTAYNEKTRLLEARIAQLEVLLRQRESDCEEFKANQKSLEEELNSARAQAAAHGNEIRALTAENVDLKSSQRELERRIVKLESFKRAILSSFDEDELATMGGSQLSGLGRSSMATTAHSRFSPAASTTMGNRSLFSHHHTPASGGFDRSELTVGSLEHDEGGAGGLAASSARHPPRHTSTSTTSTAPSTPSFSGVNSTSFFTDARKQLSAEQFSSVLNTLKEFNSGRFSKDACVQRVRAILGQQHALLADQFCSFLG